jgi:hypothetical protein
LPPLRNQAERPDAILWRLSKGCNAGMSSNWRPLNGDEKIQAVKDWLKKRWSDDYKEGKTTEDQSVDYYFYLGRKSTIEDLQHYMDFILEKMAYVDLSDNPQGGQPKA